jgi:hypothetical protein
VNITTPADGASFYDAAAVTFTATATDDEDGNLAASIAWSSSRDGSLGTVGGTFSTSALSVGTHVITASVTDSALATRSDSIWISITGASSPPVVTITAPADGASFDEAATVSFTATATDDEDGNLAASIAWSSSRDGSLGTLGGTFSTSALSIGTHVITASVTDSALATHSDSITISIMGSGGTDAYEQEVDGTVSIEAEHPDANVEFGGGLWGLIGPAGASGGQAMEASVDGQPRLEYRVNFTQTGTYYAWLRSWGGTAQSDSEYFGINGDWFANTVTMSPRNSWQWEGPFTINVATAGVQTLGVTRRESLAQVDKIFVGTSPGATPTGTGPAESSRGD